MAPSRAAELGAEQVDALLEKARIAMQERRYIEPANDNALLNYRNVLLFEPNNGEARQGLDRLAGVLLQKAQSAFDQRRYDQALLALETARTISPGDARAAALDARLASVRSEIGAGQIQAALNAQNFDRASALIDDAARGKSLSANQLAVLRDDLRRRRGDLEPLKYVRLAQTRLQQDRLADGSEDSARAYIEAARKAGATPIALAELAQDFSKRVLVVAHAGIERRNFADVDRLLNESRGLGVSDTVLAGLQKELAVARNQAGKEHSELAKLAEQVQQKLTQGSVLEPQSDNALYYLNQLRAADPKNLALAGLSRSVQAEILGRARAALDHDHPKDAESLLHLALGLGPSLEATALTERLDKTKAAEADSQQFISAASFKVIKPIRLEYPARAMGKGIEGWVDLQFTVNAEGRVQEMLVLAATPEVGGEERFAAGALRTRQARRRRCCAALENPLVVQAGQVSC
jgi:TonB family protein